MKAKEFLKNYFKDFDLDELEPDEIAEVMTAYHYRQTPKSTPPQANTLTEEDVAWGGQTALENQFSRHDPVEFMKIWRACAKWMRERTQQPEPKTNK